MSTGNMRPAEATTGAPPRRSDTGPDRASPTWRSRAGRRATPSAPRAPGRRPGRRPGCARATRRRSRSRRRRATDRPAASGGTGLRSRLRCACAARPWCRGARDSRRSRRPARPSVAAMRRAAARAASRRGSSMTILPSPSHGASSSAKRHARRLAGAGRRHQHGGIARLKRLFQARQRFIDRKRIDRGGL